MKKLLFMFLIAGILAACNDVANGVKEKKMIEILQINLTQMIEMTVKTGMRTMKTGVEVIPGQKRKEVNSLINVKKD